MSEHDTPHEGRSGYPEEEPPGIADGPQEPSEEKPQRQGGRDAGAERPGAGNEDEGTATGNPRSAGSDPLPAEHREVGPGGANPSPRHGEMGV